MRNSVPAETPGRDLPVKGSPCRGGKAACPVPPKSAAAEGIAVREYNPPAGEIRRLRGSRPPRGSVSPPPGRLSERAIPLDAERSAADAGGKPVSNAAPVQRPAIGKEFPLPGIHAPETRLPHRFCQFSHIRAAKIPAEPRPDGDAKGCLVKAPPVSPAARYNTAVAGPPSAGAGGAACPTCTFPAAGRPSCPPDAGPFPPVRAAAASRLSSGRGAGAVPFRVVSARIFSGSRLCACPAVFFRSSFFPDTPARPAAPDRLDAPPCFFR